MIREPDTTGRPNASHDPDSLLTLENRHRRRIKIRASTFIGTAAPVGSRSETRDLLTAVSKEMHDATHHCWAFSLAEGGKGFNDAGEPSGTAGQPILSALLSAGIVDAAVVVTRYFGGVKLGTGGLARAYRQAAEEVISEAPKAVRFLTTEVGIRYPIGLTGRVEPLLSRYRAVKMESVYGEVVRLTVAVRRSLTTLFCDEMRDALRDREAVLLDGEAPEDREPGAGRMVEAEE